ncbi:MAG: Wzz/FepE/Etk N-terminal domain-containing protein [Chitinophagales bacterium]
MDFLFFIKVLLRRKWLIMFVTVLAVVAAYFIASKLPESFKSKVTISTGIIEKKNIYTDNENPFVQEFQIEHKFSNLIELMTSRLSLNMISYKLLLHDYGFHLDSTDNTAAFRELGEEAKLDFTPTEIQNAVELAYKKLYHQINVDSIDHQTEIDLKQILKELRYDYETFSEEVSVARIPNTDFIKIEYESENAELSSFLVNNYADIFLGYYQSLKDKKDQHSVQFYAELAIQKKAELDEKTAALRQFKQQKGVLDLPEEAKLIVSQIKELEVKREEMNQKIPSYQGAINVYNKHLNDKGYEYNRHQWVNNDIKNLQDELKSLELKRVNDNGNLLKTQIELARKRLQERVETQTTETGDELIVSNKDLIANKIEAETELEIAKASVMSIDTELGRLRNKASGFASKEADVNSLDREITVANEEYLAIVDKLNSARLKSIGTDNPLAIVERGYTPDEPEPSNKLILAAFSGVMSGSLCIVLIFLLAYMDLRISTPLQFEKFANVPLVGTLNEMKIKNLDLEAIFGKTSRDESIEIFKESLRKIRYEVEHSGAQTFLVTSTKEGEGKTFFIISLAYSLSLNGKKVMIIDTNFKNNVLSEMCMQADQKSVIATKLIGDNNLEKEFTSTGVNSAFSHSTVDIIGNLGGYNSPSEIFAGKDVRKFIQELAKIYDYIFLESAALNKYSDAQELSGYVDKVLTVFSAESEIKQIDKNSIEYLHNLGDKFMGGILNKLNIKNLN